VLRALQDLQLHMTRKFQSDRMLTLKAFVDKAKDIHGTVINSLSAERDPADIYGLCQSK